MSDGPLPTLEQLEAALYVEAIRRAGHLKGAALMIGVAPSTAYRRYKYFRSSGLLTKVRHVHIENIAHLTDNSD